MLRTDSPTSGFADLVVADQEWVDAEFAAIIDANFATPPTGRGGAPVPRTPRPRPARWPRAEHVPTLIAPRQRSPPRLSAAVPAFVRKRWCPGSAAAAAPRRTAHAVARSRAVLIRLEDQVVPAPQAKAFVDAWARSRVRHWRG